GAKDAELYGCKPHCGGLLIHFFAKLPVDHSDFQPKGHGSRHGFTSLQLGNLLPIISDPLILSSPPAKASKSSDQSASMRHTAWAAIPSSLPEKPRCSSVVALRLTWP